MFQIDECPCCGGPLVETCPALLAPFIAERIGHGGPTSSLLLSCPVCGYRGFDRRFDGDELRRLYDGYREEEYYRARHRWEFWYTRSMNRALSEDSDEIRDRQGNAHRLVSKALQGPPPESILDYGGDRGQFIPDLWNGRKYVYEVSGRPPLPGIQALSMPSELLGKAFDLVMLCMVLEHLPDPAGQLEVIRGLLGVSGNLYVEVPMERPDLRWAGSWPWTRKGLEWLAGHGRILRLLDCYSTISRIRFNRIPFGGFLKCHEHINFFTVASLRALLTRAGFQVLVCEEMNFRGAYTQATAIGCVARPLDEHP